MGTKEILRRQWTNGTSRNFVGSISEGTKGYEIIINNN